MLKLIFQNSAKIALAMTLLIAFGSCTPLEEKATIKKPEKTLTKEIATKLSANFVKDIKAYDEIATRYFALLEALENEQKMISASSGNLAKLIKNVQMEQMEKPLAKPKFTPSASSFHNIDSIETYIAYAKQQAALQGSSVNGLRFYYGIFPNDSVKYKKKSGMMTMFITPTGGDAVNKASMFTTASFFEDSDLTGIEPLEYGGDRDPPMSTYN